MIIDGVALGSFPMMSTQQVREKKIHRIRSSIGGCLFKCIDSVSFIESFVMVKM